MIPNHDVAYTDSLGEWVPNEMHGFDVLASDVPPLEVQTVVDSMSAPHPAEYYSAHHALAQDYATLHQIGQDMETCRMHVARAHAQMRLLEEQRHAVLHRVSIHRARLSPVRIVPDQVLQEIFQRCLPDTTYIVPHPRSAPLVLTHVCRRWRAVAHGTSELWSCIALQDRGAWNSDRHVELSQEWLDRACMRPMTMSLLCPSNSNFGQNNAIFDLVIAHSARLTDLLLNVNKTYLHHFMNRARLPALQSIIIVMDTDPYMDDVVEPTMPVYTPASAFFHTPHLRRIAFVGDGSPIYLVPRALFPHLTHLGFDCNLTLDLAHLFQDFAHLQHLALTLSLSRRAVRFFPQSHHRILGPSLRHLEIGLDKDMLQFGDTSALDTLLDRLVLPALETLFVTIPTECASWENHMAWVRSPSLFALLSRSRYTQPRIEVVCEG